MSARKPNSTFEEERGSFFVMLFVNCTFTAIIALTSAFFTSAYIAFALMLRQNEPRYHILYHNGFVSLNATTYKVNLFIWKSGMD